MDDGYSGVNFDRPAFQQILEDIRSGKVNCIITKDLSRFGRNHIEVGKYIEKIFPYLGVRFIAINDHYDSLKSDAQMSSMIIPFKNLINDAYCRDISIKIRSNLEVKRKKGDYVGAFAPYGYQKSETNRNRLKIDEKAAEVVRRIFQMYLQGSSAYKIAEKLNKEDVLTPMDYKKEQGSAYYTGFKKNLKSEWTHVAILRILGNPVYMGTLIQGKNTTPNYKIKKKIRRDKSRWSTVENAHEAIISAAQFETVQNLLQTDTRAGDRKAYVYQLAGIVKCADCGGNMIRKTVPSGYKKYTYYVCKTHKSDKKVCSSHSINADKLEKTVCRLLNDQIEKTVDIERVLSTIEKEKSQKRETTRRKSRLVKKMEEIQKYHNLQLELYEDYKDGMLTREEYLELKEAYGKRIETAERAAKVLNHELEILASCEDYDCEWISEFKKHRYLKSLTRELVVSLIDKIFVYEKKQNECYPRIEVCFKYAKESKIPFDLTKDLCVSSDNSN